MEKLIDKIKDFFELRNIINGIRNIINWFPIIWNDRQWDHYYFHKVLRHKLYLMKKFYDSDSIVEDSKKISDQLSSVIDTIDRILDDDYASDCFSKHNKKYGESEIQFNDGSINIYRKKVKTPEQEAEQIKEFLECSEKEVAERNDDINYVYRMINNNIETWWD